MSWRTGLYSHGNTVDLIVNIACKARRERARGEERCARDDVLRRLLHEARGNSIAARVEPELHHRRDEGDHDQAAHDGRVNTLLVLDLLRGLEGAFGLGLVPGGSA